jgi:hypothetical protein
MRLVTRVLSRQLIGAYQQLFCDDGVTVAVSGLPVGRGRQHADQPADVTVADGPPLSPTSHRR